MTEIYVMRARRCGDTMPAEAPITRTIAETIAGLILSQGDTLIAALRVAGVVTEALRPNLATMRELLCQHCCVITGHLVKAMWPRRSNKEAAKDFELLCTCLPFALHAECEHVVYVSCLRTGEPNLASLPAVRPRGRKRKHH
jgi:hypothetical protein